MNGKEVYEMNNLKAKLRNQREEIKHLRERYVRVKLMRNGQSCHGLLDRNRGLMFGNCVTLGELAELGFTWEAEE